MRRGENDGPVALGTRFGYVLIGPVNECFIGVKATNSGTSVLRIEQEPLNRDIDFELEEVSRFFDVERVGALPNDRL